MELIRTLDQYKDPVDWNSLKSNLVFLGHGPQRLIGAVALYLLFVLKIGPMFVAKKQPYDLKNLVRVYNLFNIAINVYLAFHGLRLSDWGASFISCRCLETRVTEASIYIDTFILSRVIDFLDTVFFILRKKDNQVTVLHVYHHAQVPLVIYMVALFSMNPFSGFLLVLNSIVHTVMYTYYLLATFPSIAKHLWWKKHITHFQISQFLISIVYFTLGYWLVKTNCNGDPIVPVVINLLTAGIFVVLFSFFYASTYVMAQKNKMKDK